MLVLERMTRRPVIVAPDVTVPEALQLMRERQVRRLPVLDADRKLVGIVSDSDLLYASPPPSAPMSFHEMSYQLSKTTVADVMVKDVITISEFTPIEEAACLMADRKIGGLPVVRDGRLVGIITETDLFKIFLELLGAREAGVRVTMLIPEQKGMLADITHEISGLGGNIVAMCTFRGEHPTNKTLVVKVTDVDKEKLSKVLTAIGMEIIDLRETTSGIQGCAVE
jgi:acetoin utilization protein AcuB